LSNSSTSTTSRESPSSKRVSV